MMRLYKTSVMPRVECNVPMDGFLITMKIWTSYLGRYSACSRKWLCCLFKFMVTWEEKNRQHLIEVLKPVWGWLGLS